MEIQEIGKQRSGNATDAGLKFERNMTVEYRTLSIQLSRHNQQQYSEAEKSGAKSFFSRIFPVRKAYDRRQASENKQEAKLGATADELSTLKFHLDT
ncbi:hypothetical protein EC988_009328, partial [Linderina pennispora]